MRRWGPPLLLLLAILGAWELYVDLGGADRFILPPPHDVARSLYEDRSLLWANFLVTAREVVFGIVLAATLALGLATSIHFSRGLRQATYPLIVASQAVPVPAVAGILVFWLGFGMAPKLVVVAVVSFFSIVVTTLAGLDAVDPDVLKLMRSFDSTPARTFRLVELPAALPGLLTGTRIAVAVSVIGAVIAEQAIGASTQNPGLGWQISLALNQAIPARAVAAVVVLSLFAITLFALLTLAERRAVPWAYQPRGDR